jgi:hypothetical protein
VQNHRLMIYAQLPRFWLSHRTPSYSSAICVAYYDDDDDDGGDDDDDDDDDDYDKKNGADFSATLSFQIFVCL